MTTIRYFLPEDGDDEAYPNVFLAPKSRNHGEPPTLAQVRNAFPLEGSYHFRFKAPLIPGVDKGMAVWMDPPQNENAPVSTYKNTIVCKVTRLSMEPEEDSDDEDFVRPAAAATAVHSTPAAAPPRQAPPAPTPAAAPLLDVFESSNHSKPVAAASANLLNVPSAPSSGGSLLDMETPVSTTTAATASNNSHHADFLGMTSTPQQHHHASSNNSHYHHQQTPQQQSYGGYPQQQNSVARPPHSGNAYNSQQQQQQGPFGGLQWGN